MSSGSSGELVSAHLRYSWDNASVQASVIRVSSFAKLALDAPSEKSDGVRQTTDTVPALFHLQ